MKFFLWKIALFLMGLVIINFLLYQIVYANYYRTYESPELGGLYHTYLLSDSHGLPLKNKLEKHGIYNFSAGSDSYRDIYIKLKFLIKETNVKRIVISIDDQLLSKYRETANNIDRSCFFANGPEDFNGYTDFIKFKFFKRYTPLLNSKSRDIVKQVILSKIREEKSESGNENWAIRDDKYEASQKRARQQFPSNLHSDLMLHYLKSILRLSEVHGIEIVGIKFPLSKDYIKSIDSLDYGLSALFVQKGIKILNYKYVFVEDDFFFKDQDHVNDLGGDNLSVLIHADLQN